MPMEDPLLVILTGLHHQREPILPSVERLSQDREQSPPIIKQTHQTIG